MVFDHNTVDSLAAAVVLVNSAEAPDTMTTIEDLDTFFAAHRYTGRHDGDAAELESVRALRAPLRELLTADRDQAVVIVNRTLAAHTTMLRLVRHDGWDYHLHAVDPDAPLAERITVETAMAMVDVIRADELRRLSLCANEGCDGIVLDLSRNRSRRYCSAACGNRVAVAAYRARRAEPRRTR